MQTGGAALLVWQDQAPVWKGNSDAWPGSAEERPLFGEVWEGFMEEGAFEQGQVDISQAEKGPKHARQRLGQGLRGMNKGVLGKVANRINGGMEGESKSVCLIYSSEK